MPASGAIRIDPDVPLEVACLIGCAVQTGVGAAINTAQIQPGDSVLVLGAGGVGISIVQGAAIAGASRIIVSDPTESRREQALRFGATDVIDPTSDDPVTVAKDLTGIGVDAAFDAVGSARLVESGIEAVRSGGTVVMVGAAPIDQTVTMMPVFAMFTEKRIVGSLLGSCWAPRDIPRLVGLWQTGRLDLDGMITARRPLEEVNEATDDLARRPRPSDRSRPVMPVRDTHPQSLFCDAERVPRDAFCITERAVVARPGVRGRTRWRRSPPGRPALSWG